MKAIKQSIYDNLTSAQRTTAIVEAIKRGDQAEAERLMENIERKIYEQPDMGFTNGLILQMLDDNTVDDMAGAYKILRAVINYKEQSKNKDGSYRSSSNVNDILQAALDSVKRDSAREREIIIAEYERERALKNSNENELTGDT